MGVAMKRRNTLFDKGIGTKTSNKRASHIAQKKKVPFLLANPFSL